MTGKSAHMSRPKKRVLMLVGAAVTVTLGVAGSAAADPSAAHSSGGPGNNGSSIARVIVQALPVPAGMRFSAAGPRDYMTETINGKTVIRTVHVAGPQPDNNKLFGYVVDFTHQVTGRAMSSPTGTFCNYFRATHVQDPSADKQVYIQLESLYEQFQTASFPTNGGYHYFCWRGFNPQNTYYFQYTKNQNGKQIVGDGSVYDD